MQSNAEIIQKYFKQVMGVECPSDLSSYEQLSEPDLMVKLPEIIDELRSQHFALPEWYRALCHEYSDAYGKRWVADVDTTRDIVKLPGHAVIPYITRQLNSVLRDMHAWAVEHSV